jgi:hypothetical protein
MDAKRFGGVGVEAVPVRQAHHHPFRRQISKLRSAAKATQAASGVRDSAAIPSSRRKRSWLFFGLRSPLAGLVDIVPQWLVIVAAIAGRAPAGAVALALVGGISCG